MATREELAQLKNDTQWMLDNLRSQDHPEVKGVNWGSLGVVEVRSVMTLDDEYCEVIVDEVAPEASDFALLVQTGLSGMGWGLVSVVTEW